ncbi:MAG TPA: hypothetical protein VHG93_25765, partial [Longimicrobium sp.]|nr:hypothetical protein [Longimicrobium sp.]
MIAVHACWSPFGLHLWGESSPRLASLAPPKGRTPRPPRPHPFAAGARELGEALREMLPCDPGAGEITVHLPSRPRAPHPSPHLAHVAAEHGGPDAAGRMRVWTVEVLSLSAANALDALLAIPAGGTDGVVMGDSARWFGELAKLALELVAGGRVLPLLEPAHGGRWRTRWRPVLAAEADAGRVAA